MQPESIRRTSTMRVRARITRPDRKHEAVGPDPEGAPLPFPRTLHPLDLQAERQRRHNEELRKLAAACRHADAHATPQQSLHLVGLLDAARDGHISLQDARAAVADLRRQQHTSLPEAA